MDKIDKNKMVMAVTTAVICCVLGRVLGMVTSTSYYVFSTYNIITTLIFILLGIALDVVAFVGAHNINCMYVKRCGKPVMKDTAEMGVVVALASTAISRLASMIGIYGYIHILFNFIAAAIGAYFLEDVNQDNGTENGTVAYGKTTLYRKEKVIQKGSKADGWMTNVFLFFWLFGAICVWGGFIVQPRSQAPMFYSIGICSLVVAFVWTSQKIENSNIESYKKIVLPDTWPRDCSYEKYHLGLHSKGAKSSGGLFGDKNMKFYNECQSNGISHLDNDYNIQKAIKVAEKQKIKDLGIDNLRSMYNTGCEMVTHDAQVSKEVGAENLLNSERIKELNELAECMKYYGYHGMEKRKVMLRDLMQEANKKRKDAEMMQETARRTMLQKEHDWATHGGIASGIAGPAAGLATAIDIQAKNAAIREQNAKMMPYVSMVTGMYANNAQGYQQEYNKYAADLHATDTKLISSDTKETVMDNIVIEDVKYTVSKTGAVRVEAKFSVKDSYRIFDSIKPTIDGVVAARLMKDDKCVGSAYFVFPVEGIITPAKLKAICTKTEDPNAKYTIEFEAADVWAMEQL